MFRLKLSSDQQPNFGYQNCDIDQTTFGQIATGQSVEANAEAQDRLSIETVYYTGVWNPEISDFVNNLTQDQVPLAYVAWSREILP